MHFSAASPEASTGPGYLAESQTMLDRARGRFERLAASPSDGATTAGIDTAILDAIASPER